MWQQYIYNGPAGSRPYFVYTPPQYQPGTAVPLVVMLHGCTQTPMDFATGTQMNSLADLYNFIVVYPQQTSAYSRYSCWNWYDLAHQARNAGEPAIIAGIVREMREKTVQWTIDSRRIYVAGMSAGGAMSVILGATYPDMFAAIGVHAGLEYGAVTNQANVTRISRRGGPDPIQQGQAAYTAMGSFARVVPTIVFHGTSDYVVNIVNGDQVVEQWMQTNALASQDTYVADFGMPTTKKIEQSAGGRSYTVYTWKDIHGNEVQAYWKVNGMGHAWSGGSYKGSYTDSQGPNASQAIYAFFMQHPLPEPARDGYLASIWKSMRKMFSNLMSTKKE